MILVDDELVKETEEKGVWQDCVFDAICDEKVQIVQQCSKPIIPLTNLYLNYQHHM